MCVFHSRVLVLVVGVFLAASLLGCGASENLPPVFAPENPVQVAPEKAKTIKETVPKKAFDKVKRGADGRPVVAVDVTDQEMNDAMSEAKATIDRFYKAYAAPTPKQERFGLKVALRSGSHIEYVWIENVRRTKDSIYGTLLNEPFHIKSQHLGDRIMVEPQDVVDWSYVDNGYLVGGYTLRVMFRTVPLSEREAHQKALGYQIDPNRGL